MKIQHLKELNNVLKEFNISKNDICIVGSSALAYHNIRENNDIDIIVLNQTRDKIFNTDQTTQISDNIELVGFGWLPNKNITDDDIISNDKYYEKYDGFKIVKLELVLARKQHTLAVKDIKDIESINSYLKNSDYKFDEILHTKSIYKINIFKKILKKIKNRIKPYYKKLKDLQWSYCSNSDLLIMQNSEKLLAYQYKDGKFNRYDLIVRYLAIEEFFGKNSNGFDLYKKMQDKRGFALRTDHKEVDDSLSKFKKLIKNVEINGFDESSMLPIGKNQELIDGSHRLAVALYFDIKLIPIKLNRFSYDTYYGIDWFEENSFTQEEIEIIENKKKEIFYKKDIYFQIILWPPVQEYFDEIEKSISNKYNILNSYNLNFTDKEKFKSFVFGVYASDDIDNWKVEKKLSGFKKFDNNLRVLEIEILNPRFRKKEANNHDISQEVEAIKKEYRSKYMNKIDNYFYDIIMHIGDNYHHTREIAKVLKNYRMLEGVK